MKHCLWLTVVLAAILSGCQSRGLKDEKVDDLIAQGNVLVRGVEKFLTANGALPEDLSTLVQHGYIDSIPDTGIEHRDWLYVRFLPLESNQYRISVGLDRPTVFSLASDSFFQLSFRSDGEYEQENVVVHRVIDDWAIETSYAR